MVEIEIVQEYKQCWRVGQRRAVSDEFAQVLIEGGYAKRVELLARTEGARLVKPADTKEHA